MSDARPILTIHGEDADDPNLTVTTADTRNTHCAIGLQLSEPGYPEVGVDLTPLEVHLLITVLQEALDRA